MKKILIAIVLLMPLAMPAMADHGTPTPQGNCPVEDKVETGNMNDVILAAGTHVCIKGGQTTEFVTADGISTLKQLLGTGQDVSHYTIIAAPSTTTTTVPEDTTTTTEQETTTTIVDEETTTTTEQIVTIPSTTNPPEEVTTTTEGEDEEDEEVATTSGPSTTQSVTQDTLPFTGAGAGAPAIAGLLALLAGGGLTWLTRKGR